MISNNVSVEIKNDKKNKFYRVFKPTYFFAFPVIVFFGVLFAVGSLFSSAEGSNARLVCIIGLAVAVVLSVALYCFNHKFQKDQAYNDITYSFMNKFNFGAVLLLIVFLLITLFPFYVVLINSIKSAAEADRLGFTFFPQDRDENGNLVITLQHYVRIFTDTSDIDIDLVASFFNSLFYSIVPVFIGTFVSAFAAYGFAKLNYPGRAFVYNFMIFTLMVPACVSTASSYVMYDAFGWTNVNRFSLVMTVPGCFGGIGCVMFLREFFKGIPNDMLEAARIDGCGKLRIFWTIMIPLGMPAIIAQLVLGFIGTYNDFQTPLIYLKYSDQYTVQLALNQFNRGKGVDNAVASAAAVFGIVPLMILYIIFQKKIISGISFSSGLKG